MSDEWPKMYRAMLPEEATLAVPALAVNEGGWIERSPTEAEASIPIPAVGTRENMLGVIVPTDIHPDAEGWVTPNGTGLSVGPSLTQLPPGRVPERLRDKRRGARGNNSLLVFRIEMTSFRQAPVGDRLELKPTSKKHGVVQPSRRTLINDYQEDLANTQRLWTVDEE
jgi:hypothetical protein